MFNPLLLDSLLLGIQHSFEPDHVAAVSVLATEKNKQSNQIWRLIWRSSQWALGHSLTLILFGILVLILRSTLSLHVAEYVEFLIGPIMIWLGISAIRRNFRKEVAPAHAHIHSRNMLSRSFWIGMIHGLAGTGGACAIALTLAARDAYTAVLILMIQSIAIIVAMTSYGCLFALSVKQFAGKWQPPVRAINYIVGLFSMAIGIYCLLESFQIL
jgi:nickel/cobalt transporter (NicO) family protein